MEAAIQTKVLHLMTQSVIEQACRKFSNTQYEFSVNITKDDLFMNYLNEFLLKTCVKYNIDPSRIVLEIKPDYLITESITHICKKSGIKVIAEYIHNQDVLDVVTEIV